MRELSRDFLSDLKNEDGALYPILERVKLDHTLMLAIRSNYINIYYRGGNLLRINQTGKRPYQAFFDYKYNIFQKPLPVFAANIQNQEDAQTWVNGFPQLKETMDFYFSKYNKSEREFQQLIARENNFSSISNESEYFIADIEFADSDLSARFDLLAIRWLATHRQDGRKCRAALMEMKYGDDALGGKAGLLKHLQDIDAIISGQKYPVLLRTIETQFNQLLELELLKFHQCSNGTRVKLTGEDKPEVIFILANHNPRSTKLRSILEDPEITAYEQSRRFDLKFYVSSFAGYGLHADGMLTLTEFRELLKS